MCCLGPAATVAAASGLTLLGAARLIERSTAEAPVALPAQIQICFEGSPIPDPTDPKCLLKTPTSLACVTDTQVFQGGFVAFDDPVPCGFVRTWIILASPCGRPTAEAACP